MFELSEHPHRRFNPLTGQWILVSPHRARRPWQGQTEKAASADRPVYDPECYLCPGNTRASGQVNDRYASTFAFTNDFGALLPHTPEEELNEGLFRAKTERGIARVLCFSPDHSLTIARMAVADIKKVVDLWCEEYRLLGEMPTINHVQIFENKGQVMGCSNPHPHGQIWAQSSIPDEVDKEWKRQSDYFENNQAE